MLDNMKSLIRNKGFCALATSAENAPYCSLMAYVANKKCSEIYMATDKSSKKFQNMQQNPAVSLLIDTRDESQGQLPDRAMALTIEGVFRPITNKRTYTEARSGLLDRHPFIQQLLEQSGAVIFAVKITSLLLLDGLNKSHYQEL